jgi:hypothetical protein
VTGVTRIDRGGGGSSLLTLSLSRRAGLAFGTVPDCWSPPLKTQTFFFRFWTGNGHFIHTSTPVLRPGGWTALSCVSCARPPWRKKKT